VDGVLSHHRHGADSAPVGGVLRTGAFPPGCLCAAAQQICETIPGAATGQTEGAVGGAEEQWGDKPQMMVVGLYKVIQWRLS